MATGIRRETDVGRWDAVCDVLVVGFGAAGAAAAIDARSAGAEVTVLERSAAGGGTSAVSGGVIYLGGGTSLQSACGFEDSVGDMFAYLMASCGEAPDEAKVRLYCEGSVEHFEWIKAQGVPFKESFCWGTSSEPPGDDGLVFSGSERCSPYREIARPAPRGHVGQIPGQGGPILMKHLCASTELSGARIEPNHCVRELVVDDNGGVVGLVATHFGEELRLRARGGTVLTTGGFVLDDEMLARHVPRALRCQMRVAGDGDDGSGIRLGMAAGAATRDLDKASISLFVTEPWGLKRGVMVNARGQRCIQEDAYMGHLGEQALFHQDGRVWLIVDDEIYEPPLYDAPTLVAGESFEDLEAELGMPEGSLVSTLEVYNRHAARAEDPLFHKLEEYLKPLDTSPYGAIDCSTAAVRYAAFTLGGLVTDVDGHVLDPEGAVIAGLYAAGRSTSGLAVGGYSSGVSLGDATFFGRRAGLAAAAARESSA